MFPSLAPYRDSGEMCTSIHKLGVMHQPGYPLYTIVGKFFITCIMPFSNIAYRVNLLSAISTSLSSVILYTVLTKYIELGTITAGLLTASWNLFYLLWYLSLVSEMYTLNILFAIGILLLLLKFKETSKVKYLYLLAFIFGIGLGNRLDLVLISPPLLFYIISVFYTHINHYKKNFSPQYIAKLFLYSTIFFAVGFGIYLYLPIRSNSNPYLDWGHTANLKQLFYSLLRSRYGGTLDLISVNYRKGENFFAGLAYYFNHIIQHFSIPGIVIIFLGIYFLYSIDKFFFIFNTLWFLTTGVVFIYLANMPPNPHAMAILEAHLILPTLPLFIFFYYGIKFLLNTASSKYFPHALSIALLLFVVLKTISIWNSINKRQNFILQDYSKNLLRGIPKNSIVVIKEDVQIFSQWYRWYVENKFINIIPVAQGLSGSIWYQNQMKHILNDKSLQSVYFTQLKDRDGFYEFVSNNKTPVFFATNTEIPPNNLTLLPYGLSLLAVNEKKETSPPIDIIDKIVDELYIYRVRYYYNYWYEFFTPDIIEDYARGYHQIGMLCLKNNNYELAKKYFLSTIAVHPYMGLGYEGLGYIFFSSGEYNNAITWYKRGKDILEKLYEKAVKYKANEDVKISILEDWANIVNNLGVIYEHKNENETALKLFNEILEKLPNNLNALYNKFVVHYKLKEIKLAAKMIQKIYSIDPKNQQIRPYLWLLNYE
jgi:tetratricopeptide (TPR) repeat protein